MSADDLDPILIQVTIPLPLGMIYSAWIDPAHLAGWLCAKAEVEPRVGGRYALVFPGPPPFESRGEVLRMTPEVDLEFSWRAPAEFAALMNEPTPRTHVYVRLQESPEGIDVTLEHAGWGSGDKWEEARSWHFHLWDERLAVLKSYLLKAAYG